MTPRELYDAVVLQSDITTSELLYDRELIVFCIRQAMVDVLIDRLMNGDYNAGSRVYTTTGLLAALRPVDSFAGGTVTGVPLYNYLWEAVLDVGLYGSYPLIIESAYLIRPINRRLVYLPVDVFVSANAMLGNTKLRKEYSFTLFDDYRTASASSGSGSNVYESEKVSNFIDRSNLLIWFTAQSDEPPAIELRYWREPYYDLGGWYTTIEMPDIYHGRIVSRAVQLLSNAVQQVPYNAIQSMGGSRALREQMQSSQQRQREEQ